MRRGPVRACCLLTVLLLACVCPALAGAAGFGQVQRYVFVPEAGSSDIEVIDTGTDAVAGALAVGVVPVQVEVSAARAALLAIDGRSAALVVSDLVTGAAAGIKLSVVARRLTLSADGLSAAVTDLDGGGVAFVDLLAGREVARAGGLAPLRDIMFSASGEALYYAAAGLGAVGVIDTRSGRSEAPIVAPHAGSAGLARLRRSPDGRRVFAMPQGGGKVDVIDLEQGRAVTEIAAGAGEGGVYPSGSGASLIVLEPDAARVSVLTGEAMQRVALAGADGMDAVYPAWLDSVAFVPSRTQRRLFVYDLDRPALTDQIQLAGVPVRGSVTADSQKLYLPLVGARRLLVLDARTRGVAKVITLEGEPLAAMIAGGFGICH